VLRAPVFVFLLSLTFVLALHHWGRGVEADGLYHQPVTSDALMQALPVVELRDKPFASLWYLHKQPPGYDLIRLLIVQVHRGVTDPVRLLAQVDATLYRVWAVLLALQCALMFTWLRALTGNTWVGLVASGLWLVYPGALFCATFFDPTLLSSLVVFWFSYELWRLSRAPQGSVMPLALAGVAMFYVRSFYQWYFFFVPVLCLVLLRVPRAAIVKYATVTALLVVPFLAKQYALFGWVETSSIAGYHYCGVMWYRPTFEQMALASKHLRFDYPEGAKAVRDVFNTEEQYRYNLIFQWICKRHFRKHPRQAMRKILGSMEMNLASALEPVSSYRPTPMIDRLPWRAGFDAATSGVALVAALCVGVSLWVGRMIHGAWAGGGTDTWRRAVALALPVAYTLFLLSVGNRYDWQEANRLRFILDPICFVFVVSQLWWFAAAVYRRYGPAGDGAAASARNVGSSG